MCCVIYLMTLDYDWNITNICLHALLMHHQENSICFNQIKNQLTITFLTFETDQFLFLAMWNSLILCFTGRCMLYRLCQLPSSPQFSMLFLFKTNNSLYISFQSFINMQILSAILLHNNLHGIHKNTELLFWLTWRGNNSHCLHDALFTNKHETKNNW